jgi:hypothetical protein
MTKATPLGLDNAPFVAMLWLSLPASAERLTLEDRRTPFQ